jgi:hypothetical protein
MRVTRVIAIGIGALAIGGTLAATAEAQAGRGTSLCMAVPGSQVTFPAGGHGYNFVQPPPAAPPAFFQVCEE